MKDEKTGKAGFETRAIHTGHAIYDTLKSERKAILRLAAGYGASNVGVFGSVVRGEAGPGSDVDFLVTMETGRSLLDLIGLEQQLKVLLSRKVDVISERGISSYLKDRILVEAELL